MPAERFVPLRYSRAVLPSVFLVLALATLAQAYHEKGSGVWTFVPVATSVMAELLARLLTPGRTVTTKHAPLEDYQGRDVPLLKRLYNIVMVGAAGAHICSLFALASLRVLGEDEQRSAGVGMARGQVWRWEGLLTTISIMALCLIGLSELQRVGIAGSSVAKRAWSVPVGCLLLGPGAMLMVSWNHMESGC